MASNNDRRGFLQRLLAAGGLAAAAPAASQAQGGNAGNGDFPFLPKYTRAQNYKSLKQSQLRPHRRQPRLLEHRPRRPRWRSSTPQGPGVISHIWFTIAARSDDHLKELVLRGYWDGNAKPSVEAPIGDFFGLNLNTYQIYQSEYLACSPGQVAELLFRHAVPAVGALHRHQRRQAGSRFLLLQHRLHDRAAPARRRALLPRAVPAERRRACR